MTGLRYVYGIVPDDSAATVGGAGVVGIDGGPVRALAAGPFAAVYSEVDEEEYGEARLNDRVRDLEWLTPRAAAHQSVNARILELAGVVLPLSFGALYRDDDRVRELLREDVPARTERLRALDGRGEWVVTILRDGGEERDASGELRDIDRQIAESAPGRGYLLTKRRASVSREATARADADAAERALAQLVRVSERAYREPVAQGGEDIVVLRVSLLAPRAKAGDIDGAIARLTDDLAQLGYRVRTTGPWPAYRFGSL